MDILLQDSCRVMQQGYRNGLLAQPNTNAGGFYQTGNIEAYWRRTIDKMERKADYLAESAARLRAKELKDMESNRRTPSLRSDLLDEVINRYGRGKFDE